MKLLLSLSLLILVAGTYSQVSSNIPVPAYKGIFTAAPKLIPTPFVPDAAISGNGDVGIVLGGTPDKLCIYIAKNDFWKAKRGYPDGGLCLPGGIFINMPALAGASFYAEQLIQNGTIKAVFKNGTITVNLNISVAAESNRIITELNVTGGNITVVSRPWSQEGFDSRNESGRKNGVAYASRHFDEAGLDWPSHVSIALKTLGAPSDSFVLKPAEKVTLLAGVCTNHDNADYLNAAINLIKNATPQLITSLKKGNDAWWKKFWSKSGISIGDTMLEKYYYGSQYLLACCSRNKQFPPGLCGNTITADALTAWQGDYHTNYNFEAPWWGCYSSNHIELTEGYDEPILAYMPRAKNNAQSILKCRGVYYPVGLGPKGFPSTFYPLTEKKMMTHYRIKDVGLEGGEMFCAQRSNAVFLTANMFQRFYHTYDYQYGKKVYPFIRAVADFWEDYLTYADGKYNSYNDNFWEVGPWTENWRADMQAGDTNNTATLGLLKMFYKGIIDMSNYLNVDEDKTAKWRDIQNHLYELPLTKTGGAIRVKATERGTSSGNEMRTKPGFGRVMSYAWVFPAGLVGEQLNPSLTALLKKEVERWDTDPGGDPAWDNLGNGFETYFTTAVRVGINPEVILKKLKERIPKTALPNLWVPQSGGLTETLSAIPSCINEMLLQGYEGVVKVFPAWPKKADAKFINLRTYGAFLVSAEMKNQNVAFIKIVSEKGNTCVIENPWEKEITIISGKGKKVKFEISGNTCRFKTIAGESYYIKSNA